MTQTFHLESSQADRIAFDEQIATYARALFHHEDYAADRVRRGDVVADDLWDNTHIEIEQSLLAVDNEAEAEARYRDAFARAWDEERAEMEAAMTVEMYLVLSETAHGKRHWALVRDVDASTDAAERQYVAGPALVGPDGYPTEEDAADALTLGSAYSLVGEGWITDEEAGA